ncbi:MAG: hypothetical protein IPK07_21030 [Deltaproteobacteria bacterium]|nr:hypothetical protein [Deltaproteobacteria bacterium]
MLDGTHLIGERGQHRLEVGRHLRDREPAGPQPRGYVVTDSLIRSAGRDHQPDHRCADVPKHRGVQDRLGCGVEEHAHRVGRGPAPDPRRRLVRSREHEVRVALSLPERWALAFIHHRTVGVVDAVDEDFLADGPQQLVQEHHVEGIERKLGLESPGEQPQVDERLERDHARERAVHLRVEGEDILLVADVVGDGLGLAPTPDDRESSADSIRRDLRLVDHDPLNADQSFHAADSTAVIGTT